MSRPTQYEDPLRVAAETMRYGIVQANELYEAVARKLEDPSADTSAFVRAMLSAEGAFVPPAVEVAPDEAPTAATTDTAEASADGDEPTVTEAASEDASEPIISAETTESAAGETSPPQSERTGR